MYPTLAKVMSNAPSDNLENSTERATNSNISLLTGTGAFAASRLRYDSSLSGLKGLIARSIRCISSITASSAASPAAGSSCHSSARIAVPMIASSLLIHLARVGLTLERNPRVLMILGIGLLIGWSSNAGGTLSDIAACAAALALRTFPIGLGIHAPLDDDRVCLSDDIIISTQSLGCR